MLQSCGIYGLIYVCWKWTWLLKPTTKPPAALLTASANTAPASGQSVRACAGQLMNWAGLFARKMAGLAGYRAASLTGHIVNNFFNLGVAKRPFVCYILFNDERSNWHPSGGANHSWNRGAAWTRSRSTWAWRAGTRRSVGMPRAESQSWCAAVYPTRVGRALRWFQ